jgi:endonuclease G
MVAVPDFLFRILIREDPDSGRPKVLAFRYPQQGTGFGKGPYDHKDYLVSIDSVEEATGLDFLTALPDNVEKDIEAKPAEKLWE